MEGLNAAGCLRRGLTATLWIYLCTELPGGGIHTRDILIAKLILIPYLRIHTSYFLSPRASSTLFVLLRQL